MTNQKNKGNRLTASWFYYDKNHGIEKLAPHAEMISSVIVLYSPDMVETLPTFIKQCHDLDIEVYKIVMGNESALDTPQAAQTTIKGYFDDIKKFGFDGIDVDFEALNTNIQDKYATFLRDLSAQLHDLGKKMSHCVGYYPPMFKDPPEKFFYDPELINDTCDLVRVMCYDMYYAGPKGQAAEPNLEFWQGGGIGPTSSKPWTKEAMQFWLRYIAREKLLMALPAYSNDYDITAGLSGRQIYCQSSPGVHNDVKIGDRAWQGILANVKPGTQIQRHWLYCEAVNLYQYTDNEDHIHFFYASDADSTTALLEVADELDIPYIGFWSRRFVTQKMWTAVKNWHQQTQKPKCQK